MLPFPSLQGAYTVDLDTGVEQIPCIVRQKQADRTDRTKDIGPDF